LNCTPGLRWLQTGSLALLILTSGCASLVSPEAAVDPSPINSWSGRFAVSWRTGAMQSDAQASGRFDLRTQGSRVELEALSSFGQTIARATSAPGRTVLETADGERHEAGNPEVLTENVLGWRVPVSRLPEWLQRASAKNAQAQQFTESGWSVQISAGVDLPAARLTLRWPAGDSAERSPNRVMLRLVLDAQE
jgi:outer membrane biogenesis lipoprotein LolB